MKQRFWTIIGFLFLIIGMGVCIYLTSHHYGLMYGTLEQKSFCNVNATLDCDAVNSSSYSEVAGVPVSLLGLFAFLTELLLLLGIRAFTGADSGRLSRYYLYLSSLGLGYSVYLALVSSLILKTYCIMCISLYVVNIVVFLSAIFIAKTHSPQGTFSKLGEDVTALFKSGAQNGARGVLGLLFMIPVASLLINGMWRQSIAGDLDKFVSRSVADWQSNKKVDFDIKDAFEAGNPAATFKIVEFSDFQCPHCKRAAPTIHAFVAAHRADVHFIFQNYPLDPNCNPAMKNGGHDLACLMARAAMCALKQGKFTEAHDWIFAHQESLSAESIDPLCNEIGLDKAALNSCMQDPVTKDIIAAQVARGTAAGVEGTPSVFVNGKMLPGGFLIPVLEAALKTTR